MSVCRFTLSLPCSFFFFFNDTATPEIYPLPLHAALPICPPFHRDCGVPRAVCQFRTPVTDVRAIERSEEHTSELQSRLHLVCRLLLEKKKKRTPRLVTSLSQDR